MISNTKNIDLIDFKWAVSAVTTNK